MSDTTHAALEAALNAHMADLREGDIVTDYVMVIATTDIDAIGTGATTYFIEANSNQPLHTTLGLIAYAHANAPFENDYDDDDD